MRWLIFLMLIVGLQNCNAQLHADKESRWQLQGNQLMKHGNFHAAIKLFQRLDSLYPGNPAYSYALGRCTFRVGDKPSSLLFFLKSKQLGYPGTELLFDLAKAYYFNNDVDNALFYLTQFESQSADGKTQNEKIRQEAIQLRKHIISSQDILHHKLSIALTNMGSAINSAQADYVPIPVGEGELVFTSRRHKSTGGKLALDGAHFEDIYVSKKDTAGHWLAATHFNGFNSARHDANVALNQDGTLLVIYKAKHNGDLFASTKQADGQWSALKPLRGINSLYWEGSACLSFDETQLFFSSDRPGGYGGSDLYSATLSPDGTWANVTNLGAAINTTADEDAPFLYKDGKTLFFSSKGHNSLGGYDIFSAHLMEDRNWGEVKNMGFPINTFDDDIYFHLTSNGSIGYFTSFHHSNFKEKSIGEKDVFQISRPHASPALFLLKGKVVEKESGDPVTAVVTIKDISGNDRRQVSDLSTGTFKFELQFEKKYQLSVQIGSKIYNSGELYFPYQADLFEYFLPVSLDSIPTFDLKLSDLVHGSRGLEEPSPVLLKKEQRAIVLVRKATFDDPDLKKLLKSDKIPFSFRAKMAQQQKDTSFLDVPAEGNLKADLFSSLLDTTFIHAPVKLPLPDNARRETIDPVTAREHYEYSVVKKELSESGKKSFYNRLSSEEQQLVDRLAQQVIMPDTAYQVNTFDLLYYENLSPEEKIKIKGEVIARSQQEGFISEEIQKKRFLMLQELLESSSIKALTKSKMAFYDKEAWEVLYTVETGGFSDHDQLQFAAILTKRNSGVIVPAEKLKVMEDDGLLVKEILTDNKGAFVLSDLQVGKRYHILVNDYTIALTGLSRYQLQFARVLPVDEDYMLFYNQLTPEEKRRVDRLSASMYLKEVYGKNPLLLQEDPSSYERLSESDKEFSRAMQRYLNAENSADPDFEMEQRHSLRYESMEYTRREKYDRLITHRALLNEQGEVKLSQGDSAFYQQLNAQQKYFITQISHHRSAQKHMMGAWQLSEGDSQYWFEMRQVNTGKSASNKVRISGKITSSIHSVMEARVSVALMDDSGELVSVVEVDSTGRFIFYSMDAERDFKILLSKPAVGEAIAYNVADLRMEPDEKGLYDKLSESERRRMDRIMARNLSAERYVQSPELAAQDEETYRKLSATEKAFIKRLQLYLFADTVTEMNATLEHRDHHTYYTSLTWEERSFINRYVMRSYRDTLTTQRIGLTRQDSMVYRQLSAVQTQQLHRLQQERKKAEDIFAENPVLIGMRRRIFLDSLIPGNYGAHYDVKGKLNRPDQLGAANVNVYLSDSHGNLLAMVTSDSNGYFTIPDQSTAEELFLMVESTTTDFFFPPDYQVRDFHIEIKETHRTVATGLNHRSAEAEIHFDYNSFVLNAAAIKQLTTWLGNQQRDVGYSYVLKGHTDAIGTAHTNTILSQKRARSIEQFLISKGARQIEVHYYGEEQIKYQQTELNRRVEIIVSYE